MGLRVVVPSRIGFWGHGNRRASEQMLGYRKIGWRRCGLHRMPVTVTHERTWHALWNAESGITSIDVLVGDDAPCRLCVSCGSHRLFDPWPWSNVWQIGRRSGWRPWFCRGGAMGFSLSRVGVARHCELILREIPIDLRSCPDLRKSLAICGWSLFLGDFQKGRTDFRSEKRHKKRGPVKAPSGSVVSVTPWVRFPWQSVPHPWKWWIQERGLSAWIPDHVSPCCNHAWPPWHGVAYRHTR